MEGDVDAVLVPSSHLAPRKEGENTRKLKDIRTFALTRAVHEKTEMNW